MAFDFYFAGNSGDPTNQLLLSLNANILRSYMTERKNILWWVDRKKEGWQGKLLIDNGAFTVHRKGGIIDIDKYIEFINDYGEWIDYFIALDDIPGKWGEQKTIEEVIQSPKKTWDNYLYMYDRVKYPKKLLPVFHQHETFDNLVRILTSGKPEYICISGNKELTNKQREDWYQECYNLINRYNPNIKVHCLGSATIENAVKFPFTSMDATTWIMVGANGSILTDYGMVYISDRGKYEKDYIYNLPEEARNKIIDYCKSYGISLDDAAVDYAKRAALNIHYLYNKSINCQFEGLKTKKRSLF